MAQAPPAVLHRTPPVACTRIFAGTWAAWDGGRGRVDSAFEPICQPPWGPPDSSSARVKEDTEPDRPHKSGGPLDKTLRGQSSEVWPHSLFIFSAA